MKCLPRSIRAIILVGGAPASGLAVYTSIKTMRKNAFGCIWGPSDVNGQIVIDGADLLRQAEVERHAFIMDYGHPEGDGAGRIEVSVIDIDDLDRALKAYEIFSTGLEYAAGYHAMILEARRRTAELGGAVPALSVASEGGDCHVVVALSRGAG